MKRVLALVLALVMVLAPMSAFASSDNRVVAVPTVVDDHEFTRANSDAPILRLEEKDLGEFSTSEFRLNLTNAEWTDEMFDTVGETVYAKGTTAAADVASLTFTKRTATSAQVSMTINTASSANEYVFEIPMLTELQGAGEAKVTIEALNSAVSAGTYTFALGAGGDTVASVGSTESMERGDNTTGTILIDEVVKGSLGTGSQGFRLRLPKDFEWKAGTDIEFINLDVASSIVVNGTTRTLSNNKVTLPAISQENDGRDLIVEFTVNNKSTVVGTIKVAPVVEATKDAEFGDVAVHLRGLAGDIANQNDLVIGEYKDYGVSVSIDEVKTFLAGRVDDTEYITGEIKIKENIEGSLLSGRVIDFELPSWVKLAQNRNGADNSFEIKSNKTGLYEGGTDTNSITINIDDNDMSKFSVEIAHTQPAKQEIKFELPITIKANEAGEINLNVKGAGIEEQDLVIAEAIAPVTAEVEMADVRVGIQGQEAPDIIITEAEAGAIRDKGYSWNSDGTSNVEDPAELIVAFKDNYGFNFDDATYEVIEGDLEIDQDASDVDDKELKIAIKAESTKPSTIKVSGIKMTLDRTVPEGPFQVDIKGSAVVDNPEYKDFTSRVARFDFANVITRAGGVVASEAKFVIGEATYTVLVNGKTVEKVMDTAAFIENGRTMLPVRYVAEALGVSEDNIVWNGQARTVTVFKDARVVQLTIDNDIMMVNGVPVQMDSAAIIRGGRTFLPVRFVAQALNADIQWDAATRTVTINQ